MWRVLENVPIFMRHLESVRAEGDGRSEWTAIGPMNTRIRWKAEITEDRENEFLAWRSTRDSEFQNWGSLEFRARAGESRDNCERGGSGFMPEMTGIRTHSAEGKFFRIQGTGETTIAALTHYDDRTGERRFR
jgi:uncharacterized membrane protein